MSVKLRERTLPSGKKQLFLDIYHKGTRIKETLDLQTTGDRKDNRATRDLAERIRAKRQLQYTGEAEGFLSPSRKKTNFFLFAKSIYENKSPRTQATYRNSLLYLEAFAGSDLTFEQITPALCERFKNFLLKGDGTDILRGLKKVNSVAAYYERFRIVLKRAVEDNIITQNPTKGITVKTQEALPKYLTTEQLEVLAKTKCGNTIVRDAFFFSYCTGMRFGDIVSLKWGQFRDSGVHIVQSKTGVSQKIDLNKMALSILNRYRKPGLKMTETVFALPRRSTVDKVLKRWAKRASLEMSISFHRARHSFATAMLTSTGDIYTTSKILGHKSLATTQIYAKVVDEKRKRAITSLPSITGM
jgi:site-specific recombinase XerD